MGASDPLVNEIVKAISAKSKYRAIHPGLIESLAVEELGKGRSTKETIKAVSAKLHQVGAAYFQQKPDYENWVSRLNTLPADIHSPEMKSFCLGVMRSHSSTSERLPILEDFFHRTLESIAPVKSILDLACGLNPLALAWMPATEDIRYTGCDIFIDMLNFLEVFFRHTGHEVQFKTCDLTEMRFTQKAQVAFLLKTLPCLEQLEKGINAQLLEKIPAEYLLISYPVRSLGGRAKGMGKTYEAQFNALMEGRGWGVQRFEFANELAFLVKNG